MRSTAHNGHSKLGRSMTAHGTNRSTSDKNKCVIKSPSFADKTQMGIKRNGGSKGLDKFGPSYGQQVSAITIPYLPNSAPSVQLINMISCMSRRGRASNSPSVKTKE